MLDKHPNPIFARKDYRLLNGMWQFDCVDIDDKLNCDLSENILIPYCPESKMSGIGRAVPDRIIYSRLVEIEERDLSGRLVLHFGAVNYNANVYINGKLACTHNGGYTPFSVDIAKLCVVGTNRITVLVENNVSLNTPSGKQSAKGYSYGCFYTKCSGIWQSVWLEHTPENYIEDAKFYPDVDNCSVTAKVRIHNEGDVSLNIYFDGVKVGSASDHVKCEHTFNIKLAEKHIWDINRGNLYEVEIIHGDDTVYTYFGLRNVCYDGYKFLLNGKSVFQRLVLDQGYYFDGNYTGTDEEFLFDIHASLDLGFNGARLHQKLFDPRYLYLCDKMGFMVWGEFPSWGIRYSDLSGLGTFMGEWSEAVERDFNHPSIITWCPLNETWYDLDEPHRIRDVRFIESVYALTKSLDSTRPCVDVSGGFHGRYTDLYDFHCYESSELLAKRIADIGKGVLEIPMLYAEDRSQESELRYPLGAPLNASEIGGIAFSANTAARAISEVDAWGYTKLDGEEDFVTEYLKIIGCIIDNPYISGLCYTQLYDIEQEQNGFFTYDRKPKLSVCAMDRMAKGILRVAEIERNEICSLIDDKTSCGLNARKGGAVC